MNDGPSRPMSRRSVLWSGAAAALIAPIGRAAGSAQAAVAGSESDAQAAIAAASARPLAFDVLWGGDVIGAHVVRFEAEGGDLRVHSAIDITVKVLWITAFDYHHTSTEVWRDGRLVSFDSETEDNGRSDTVKGAAHGDGFEVTGRRGTLMAPADIIPGTFWNPEIVSRDVVLDPKKGTLEEQVVRGRDRVRIDIGGRPRTVTRYRLDTILNGAIDYDDRGQWAGAWFKKKGGRVHYRLRG